MNLLKSITVPSKAQHKSTVIFLHGLGDSGRGWAPISQLLANSCPNTKFVFPHAPNRPVTLNMNMMMPAWYDIYSLTDRDAKVDEQGINESYEQIKQLILQEIESGIPANKIVVGGFSQGAAMSLVTMCKLDYTLAGVVCLSGYLPLKDLVSKQTPIFMGHGDADQVVALKWGEMSFQRLKQLGCNVDFRVYPNMEHTSCNEELMDVCQFLNKVL